MARPKSESADGKAVKVTFRLTEAEAAILDRRAGKSQLSRSEYLRKIALKGGLVVRKTRQEADPALLAELNRIGVNLNQLVRRNHILGKPPLRPVETLCREIETLIFTLIGNSHGPLDHETRNQL
jgi:hypothetical protein